MGEDTIDDDDGERADETHEHYAGEFEGGKASPPKGAVTAAKNATTEANASSKAVEHTWKAYGPKAEGLAHARAAEGHDKAASLHKIAGNEAKAADHVGKAEGHREKARALGNTQLKTSTLDAADDVDDVEHADETHEHYAGEFDSDGNLKRGGTAPNEKNNGGKGFTARQLTNVAEKQSKKANESEAAKSPDAATEHAKASNAHYAAAKAHSTPVGEFAQPLKMNKKAAEHHRFQGRAHANSQLALTPSGRGERDKSDSTWQRVQRVDLASGDLGERRTTPQGGLVARANMTRTGVLSYVQSDGTVRRELRHPDEVFDPKSLATLAHATLTADHPDKVTPANWRRVTIGHVAGTPHRSGKFVQGDIHIQHDAAIEQAGKGKLQELSCGYECSIDPTPGVFEGEPYDAVQRNIRYNHVAAGPAGWGRAGSEVRIHLDGGAGVSGAAAGLVDEPPRYVRAMPDSEEERRARADAVVRADAEKARADKAEAELAKLRLDAQKNEGELMILRKAKDTQESASKMADDQARADAAFDAQLEALEEARRWLGSTFSRKREDGTRKSVGDIRREIVRKLDATFKLEGTPDAIVEGAYLALINRADAAERGRIQTQMASNPLFIQDKANPFAKKGESDDDNEDSADAQTKVAQDRMLQKMKDAWKQPQRDRKNRGARPDSSGHTVPMRSAFGGGNQGNFNGGFGGGM